MNVETKTDERDPLYDHREALAAEFDRIAEEDSSSRWGAWLRRGVAVPLVVAALVAGGAGLAIAALADQSSEPSEAELDVDPSLGTFTIQFKHDCPAEAEWWRNVIAKNGGTVPTETELTGPGREGVIRVAPDSQPPADICQGN